MPSSHTCETGQQPSRWTAGVGARAATAWAATSIEHEFEDVAAVADAVAARTGGPVALWGHSYGANCAMGAAARTKNAGHLILYEPGLGMTYPAGSIEAVEEAVARGDMEGAARTLLVGIVEMTDEEFDALRSSPVWPSRLATVPTVPRELRGEADWVYRQGQFEAVTASTLLLAGSESPPAQDGATRRAAAALPDARVRMLEGHGHLAHQSEPALVAAIVKEFIGR